MLDFNLNENTGILHLKPVGQLQAEDFASLNAIIDPYLAKHQLKGVLIETKFFPGWEDMAAFQAHMKFIKNHFRKVEKIALVTDTKLASVAEKIIPFLLNVKVKHFPFGQTAEATAFLQS